METSSSPFQTQSISISSVRFQTHGEFPASVVYEEVLPARARPSAQEDGLTEALSFQLDTTKPAAFFSPEWPHWMPRVLPSLVPSKLLWSVWF